MKQNQGLSTPLGIPKVDKDLESIICNVNKVILQMNKHWPIVALSLIVSKG